jgi:DNA-binding transcriptional regulator YiaG
VPEFVFPGSHQSGIKIGGPRLHSPGNYYITTVTIRKKNTPGVEPDFRAIGKRIRQIRGFEMRQIELAKALGITQAQLSKYERGQNAPTIEILLKLKKLSGKSVDWIVTGES